MTPDAFDVIVIGGGHAGCEAALAAARMGCLTALITPRIRAIATLPCNPSVGGLGKSHLVVELDALGGEMALNADCAGLQFRILNASRGPAVRATRVQCDKTVYACRMLAVLKQCPNLSLIEDEACELNVQQGEIRGVRLRHSGLVHARAVVLAPGTALQGRIHVGDRCRPGAGDGRPASDSLFRSLQQLGMRFHALKTGTPPRLAADSIDYAVLTPQPSDQPLPFLSWRAAKGAFDPTASDPFRFGKAGQARDLSSGASALFHVEHCRDLLPRAPGSVLRLCYLTRTTARTHRLIRDHLKESARYGGYVTATGVRYCPSIEDKIVKFPDQSSHAVYLEPEQTVGGSIYVNGASNSFPPGIQERLIHSIPGLERARIRQFGYAIVYQAADSRTLAPTLEWEGCRGVYCAGQINGTTGYEEAAVQGFVAGVNAALQVADGEPFILSRQDAYIGVLIDDLVTRGADEPYRMFTSRAERRLLLRPDNARYRLLEAADRLRLAGVDMRETTRRERAQIEAEIVRLQRSFDGAGASAMRRLARPGARYANLPEALPCLLGPVIEQIEILARYTGYIEREREAAERERLNESLLLPRDADYPAITALRRESRERLDRVKPASLGQAARIPGVNPADVSILSLLLRGNRLPRKRPEPCQASYDRPLA